MYIYIYINIYIDTISQHLCGMHTMCMRVDSVPEKRSPVSARQAEGVARDVCHRMGYTTYV